MKFQTPALIVAMIFAMSLIIGCINDGGVAGASSSSSADISSSSSVQNLSSGESSSSVASGVNTTELLSGSELAALLSGDTSAWSDTSLMDAEVATAVIGYREGTVDSAELTETLTPVVDSALSVALDSMGVDVPPIMQDMLTGMIVESTVSCLGEDSLPDLTQMGTDSLATPDCVNDDLMTLMTQLSASN